MKKLSAAILTAILTGSLLSAYTGSPAVHADSTQIIVSDSTELTAALKSAKAGDEIILKPGKYLPDPKNGQWRVFEAVASGKPDQHIILRSEDPDDPATLCTTATDSKCALYITGSYWEIRDLKVSTAGKGIFLAKSEHSVISGCEVSEIGDEAIHIIDDSSYNLVENCFIHDTGLYNAKYGEGVYIGSSKNATEYGFECHYNTVRNCRFGPNITADHVDIKEYTRGNLVEYCTFDGTGIMGENGGDSFVEVKGNDAIVRYNTGHRNGCEKQRYGFDMAVLVEGWGQNNKFYDNTLFLDNAEVNILKGWSCYGESCRNIAEPADCDFFGNRVLQVLGYRLAGDANEDGLLDRTDPAFLRDVLLTKEVPHISPENADPDGSDMLDAADLTLLKRKLLQNDTDEKAQIYVNFKKEDTGKWRMSNGLGEKTVTFKVAAESGMKLNMGWGYWDPNYEDPATGNKGKWLQFSLDPIQTDENGFAEITVKLPPDAVNVALELYSCSDASGKREPEAVSLAEVRTT